MLIFTGFVCVAQVTPCANPMLVNTGSGYGALNVTLNTLNHTTPIEEGFTLEYDSLAIITNLGVCETYTLTITISIAGLVYFPKVWIDWNADGDFDDVGEEYSPDLISPTTATLAIQIPANTTLGNKIMRIAAAKKGIGDPCLAPFLDGDVEDYKINIVENDMTVDSVTVEQANDCYRQGDLCKPVLRIAVYTTGVGNPITVTGFNLSTTGSTSPGTDITNATIIYTADSGSLFQCNTPYGNAASPNGAFNINGSQVLNYNTCSGVHYFWVTYDIAAGATGGNAIDAECIGVSVIQQGTPSTITPNTTSPSGNGNINTGTEICNNGLDDDCDGLIDCYDPDCYGMGDCISESGSFYYGLPNASCPVTSQFVDPNVGLQVDWSVDIASAGVGVGYEIANAPLTGDLDGDGIVEIVVQVSNTTNREIVVLNGVSGAVLQTINFTNSTTPNYFTGILADVDNSGCSEIIWRSSANTMKCYDYCAGSFMWTSAATSTNMGEQINIADFNGDGVPEIFDYMHIWNAQTGALLGTNLLNASTIAVTDFQEIIAADVLPDTYCNNCSGLELIYGHHIFSVDITAGVATFNKEISSELEALGLGSSAKSAVSDLNGDNLLDIATTSDDLFFTWDPRTGLLIDSVSVQGLIPAIVGDVNRKSAPPVINDIDNDGNMEYLFGTKSLGLGLGIIHLFALDENLNYLWHIEHIQVESSVLPVVFDLEGDGTKEIITRGAYASTGSNGLPYLYVIDAVTGFRKDSIYAEHGTRFGADGGPIIADVDNDGMVEIITTGKLSPSGTMELAVISSNTNRWACGRRVWNQVNYHPTLINDNLTVPAQPQNIAYLPIEYNGNSIQASFKDVNGNYACPMPDVVVTIDSNSYSVNCDSLIIHTTICNIGDGSITGGLCNIPKYVSIYNGNPSSGGVLFQTDTLSCALDSSGSCVYYNQTIFTGGLSFTLFIVVNDSGVNPLSAPNIFFAECDTTNNMDMLFVISPCGNIIPPLDTAICEGDSVLLIASGSANGYNWVDSLTFTPILATDSFYMASPIATTTYAIYSTTDTAYVTVTVDSAYSFSVSQTICQGDSIQLPGGSYVSTAGSYSDLLTSSTGCDSVIITNLLVISPIVNSVSLSICAGDSILLEGVWQTSAGSYDDTTIAANGCDSIIITTLSIDSVFYASIDFVPGLCENSAPLALTVTTTGGTWSGTGIDSTTGVFDPSVAGGGTHEIVYIIGSNCGSSDTVDIEVYVLPSISFTTTDESCDGENDGSVDLTVTGGTMPYAYSWDDPVSSTTDTLMALPPGTYTVVVTDSNSCSITDSIEILQSTEPCFAPYLYIPNVFSPNDDGVNDILYVQGQGIAEFNFVLYERWGELMFETSDQTIGWDGMFEGKRLNEAVFFYYVNALTIDDKTIKKKGNITLLR